MTEAATTPAEPQRLRALEQANQIRLARAELKRRIADGDVSAAEVILGCPDAARRWTMAELLVSQRRWGSTRCRKFLERNGISEIKPIGTLTDRQRRVLAEQLGNDAPAGDSEGNYVPTRESEGADDSVELGLDAPVKRTQELVYA